MRIGSNILIFHLFLISLFLMISCESKNEIIDNNKSSRERLFISTLQKHLDAVSNKNIDSLKSTLSPTGEMQLILPNTEITKTADEFIKFHEEWFLDTTWTFETEILNTEIGKNIGIAVIEVLYKESDKNGELYFNRMNVSYGLKLIDERWYIIKDHASSIEKSE